MISSVNNMFAIAALAETPEQRVIRLAQRKKQLEQQQIELDHKIGTVAAELKEAQAAADAELNSRQVFV